MNIVHVVEAWQGGIASYVQNLIRAQKSEGHNVILFADRSLFMKDFRDLNIEIFYYESSRNPIFFSKIAKNIRKKISNLNTDVLHCHSSFPGVYCRIFSDFGETKVIYTPHGWSFFKKDVSIIKRKIYAFIEKKLARNCTKIMCMSLNEVNAAKALGMPEDKLAMIYTGIHDIPLVSISERRVGDKLKVGFFGRFDYAKGYDFLERAIPYLSTNVEVHFFGSQKEDVVGKVNEKVIYHGWIPYESIHEKILEMDIVISPSRWEGFSLGVLEAFRAAKAVIVSDKASLPETVVAGYNGLILYDMSPQKIAQSINKLSIQDCIRMGNNARRVFEQCFIFEQYYAAVNELYKD